ncbi:response regulator [Iodobacter fluviatilis]|uniref:Response regulator receiver domain-containing protein n=1 Tax=Iodobacter fluviatilis TaxID=537 RepID=A0A377Q4Q4_9NEIS|nr:response regulator [Iodobacter fluviatilis]TCU84121.1 response regulator receiver domain-containing protein [Iodobacter fluviatilis]STQ89735.1 Stalked cell differentiation-controlling protein [Iodobacter fluviatilis]
MNDKPLVLIVDDDLFMLDFIFDALSETCNVITAENGKAALQLVQQQHPKLVLADVKMPEMDGYELCRQIKDDFDISDTPVLFLSALDGIEDRLQGFDVGGEDFVLKPANPKVLQAKVAHVLQLIEERQQLKSQAQYATNTAMLAMASMSETGLLIEGIKRFNNCTTPLDLAKALISAIGLFEVESVVELILPGAESLAVNLRGPASALETSILQHMATMDRITQFKSRMAITYPHIRVLISNMPEHDEDLCGRLRDNLAILIESTEYRLEALNIMVKAEERDLTIATTIKSLTDALSKIDEQQRNGRTSIAIILSTVTSRIEAALVGLQLTERQESSLIDIVSRGLDEVSNTISADADFQDQLSCAIKALQNTINR